MIINKGKDTYKNFSFLKVMKPVLILSSGTHRFAPAASSSAVSCEIFKVATSPSSAFSLLKK